MILMIMIYNQENEQLETRQPSLGAKSNLRYYIIICFQIMGIY